MRWMALGMACVLVLSGCLMASGQTESAMGLEDEARDRAEEKLENPELVGLWGVETPREVTSNESELRIYLDEQPGDGEATSWAYAFLGEKRGGIVVVADEIGVLGEYWEDTDLEDDDRPPGLSWQVDSGEVASILAANETWPEMTDAHALSWELEHEDNATQWRVHTEEISFDEETRAYTAHVDAETGELLDVRSGSTGTTGTVEPVEEDVESSDYERGCDQESASAALTPGDEVTTDEVELEAHGTLALSVSYTGAGPLDVQVHDEDGEPVFEDSTTMVGSNSYDRTIEGASEGEYTLTAGTGSGSASVDAQLTAVWGGGFDQCEQPYGPTSEDTSQDTSQPSIPAWVHADRGLGVHALSLR